MSINSHSLEKLGHVAVPGGKIHFRYYEPHDPEKSSLTPLVVVHGGPGATHALIYDALHKLSDDRPTLYYDELGSFFSPAEITEDLMELPRFVEELHLLLEYLGLSKVVLLGHSFGASIATSFALNYPASVEKLILSCPLLSSERWMNDCAELLQALSFDPKRISYLEQNHLTDTEEYQTAVKVFSAQHACRLATPPLAMKKHGKKWNGTVYKILWGDNEFFCTGKLKNLDLFPQLKNISMPTAIICGEYDTATPKTMAAARDLIPNATLTVIKNSGHLAFIDGNEAYVQAIRESLRGVG